jgi:hypothetical protein
VPAGSQAIAAAAAEAGALGAGLGGEASNGHGADAAERVAVQQRRTDDAEPGRNDPCWCGSGKKYKKCHGA